MDGFLIFIIIIFGGILPLSIIIECLKKCKRGTNNNTNVNENENVNNVNEVNTDVNYNTRTALKPDQIIINKINNCEICSDQLLTNKSIIIFDKTHFVHKFCYQKYKRNMELIKEKENKNKDKEETNKKPEIFKKIREFFNIFYYNDNKSENEEIEETPYNMFDYIENRDSDESIDNIKLDDIEVGLDFYKKFDYNEKDAIFINKSKDNCGFCIDKKINGMPLLLLACQHSIHLECNDMYIKNTMHNRIKTCLECNK